MTTAYHQQLDILFSRGCWLTVIKENTRIDFTSVTTNSHRGRTTSEDVVEGTSHMLMGVGVVLNEVKGAQGDCLSN